MRVEIKYIIIVSLIVSHEPLEQNKLVTSTQNYAGLFHTTFFFDTTYVSTAEQVVNSFIIIHKRV